MSETRRYADLAQSFARLAAQAAAEAERADHYATAAVYLQLAKAAAAIEIGARRRPAPGPANRAR
ncbi:MAG: hypothetical protein ACXWKO_18090 [Phenylobacterium sp.]